MTPTRLLLVLICSLIALTMRGAIPVGSGPTFNYRYSPREAFGPDTNAAYAGVRYRREPPSSQNCSFIMPVGLTNLSSGTITYVFQTDPGFVIEHAVLFQKASLFAPGGVWGDYSTDLGAAWQRFFAIGPYGGTAFSYIRQASLRNVNASNLTVRYTLVLTNGSNFNVQWVRDCDDAMSAFVASGSVVSRSEAARRVTLVPARATWKYLDNGADLMTAWRQPGFDDRSWPAGAAELGYGDSDEATRIGFGPNSADKYVTTYFRHAFQVTNALGFESLLLGLLVDDGAVVYLNGQEVHRRNLPSGVIGYRTYATNALGDPDEMSFFEASLNPGLLVEGTNVLAVEVHQAAPDSSDLSFDLDLRGVVAQPRIDFSFEEGCVVLSWSAPGFVLEEAPAVHGPWTEALGNPTEVYFVCGQLTRAFYRLKRKP